MSKEETFRENFEKLLELAERTLDYDADGGRSSKNAVMTSALVSYKNVYAKTKSNPIKHIEKFNELYAKCKKAIVDSPTYEDFMEYLDATSFIISPSQGSKSRLHISMYFRNCNRIAKYTAAMSEKDESYLDRAEGLYPEYYTLYLIRIFLCGQEDKILEKWEKEINALLKGDVVPPADPTDGFMSYISEIIEDVCGKGVSSSDLKEFQKHLGNSKSREEITSTLKGLLSGRDLSNPENWKSFFDDVMTKANTPPEAVTKSLSVPI